MKKILATLLSLTAAAIGTMASVVPALPEEPSFPSSPKIYKVTDYGAVGDGTTDDTQAVQAAIDACAEAADGGTVLVSDGTFLTKTITLKSNMTFQIAEGATIRCTGEMNDFPPCVIDSKNSNWGDEGSWARAFIYAYQAENLRITGPGTINGNGYSPNFGFGKHELERPIPIYLVQCRKVLLDNFTLKDGAMWNIVPMETDDFTMREVSIDANIVANRDGIDIVDCHRVLVEKCTFYTDDDCICPKSGHSRGVEDVTVRDCDLTLSGRANGIKFGTKSYGCFRRMLFHDIRMTDIKLSGIAVESVDGATIEDIEFRDITMNSVGNPIFVILGDRGQSMWGEPRRVGSVKNILFKNITSTGTRMDLGCIVNGTLKNGTTYSVENLTFDHLTMDFPGGQTTVPSHPSEYDGRYPESIMWSYTPACGFFIRHAKGITFRDCDFTVSPSDKRPFFVTADAEVTNENVNVTEIKKDNVANANTFNGSDPELSSTNISRLWDGNTAEGIGFNQASGYICYDLSKNYKTPVELSGAAIWQDGGGAHVDRWKVQTRLSPDDEWTDACPMQECRTAEWQNAEFTAQASQVRVYIECDPYSDMFGTHDGRANLHELAVYSPSAEPLDSPSFPEGEGTADNPYLIGTPAQLDNMRNYLDAHFRLTDDIDLASWLDTTHAGEGWEPIGDGAAAFTGSLDGAGHAVSNLWINRGSDNIGLFGLTLDADIHDLAVNIAPDREVKGANNVAGLIGQGSATITRCVVTGKIVGTKKNAAAFIANSPLTVNGATCGVTTISKSYAAVDVQSTDATGGIMGVTAIKDGIYDSVSECYVTGHISGDVGTGGNIVASAVDNRNPYLYTKIVDIRRCYALTEAISAKYRCNRILGYVKDPSKMSSWAEFEQNYALVSMTVNGSTKTGVHTDHQGADIEMSILGSPETFSDPATTAWDYADTWSHGGKDYPLPVLKTVARAGQPAALPAYMEGGTTGGIETVTANTADATFQAIYDRFNQTVTFIKADSASVTIYSLGGTALLTTTASAADLSTLPAGIYIVRCGSTSVKLAR